MPAGAINASQSPKATPSRNLQRQLRATLTTRQTANNRATIPNPTKDTTLKHKSGTGTPLGMFSD